MEDNMEDAQTIRKFNIKMLLIIVGLITFGLSTVFIYAAGNDCQLLLNDQHIGYVDASNDAYDVILKVDEYVLNTYGEDAYYKDELRVEIVRDVKDELILMDDLYDQALQTIQIFKPAYTIKVDERELVYVSDHETANALLSKVEAHYVPDFENMVILDSKFVETIEIVKTDVRVTDILSEAEALAQLLPQDDQATVMSSASNLTVDVQVEITEEETIAYPHEKVSDGSLYVGQRKIKQKGKAGLKELVYTARVSNLEIFDKTLKEEAVLSDPIAEITLVGTKEYPRVAISSGNKQAIIDEAWKHVGKVPYIFGASNPAVGFDCSGFTLWVYAHAGISLPHSAEAQSRMGQTISKNDLLPGDLIFFRGMNGEPVGHVGLYIGNGQMIHASMPGTKLSVASIHSNYFVRTYVTSKRY